MEALFHVLLAIAEKLLKDFRETAFAARIGPALRGLPRFLPGSRLQPEVAAVAYAAIGAAAGGLSLLIFPHPLLDSAKFQALAVIAAPFVIGFVMAFVAFLLRRRGQKITGMEGFAYGFSFALGMALVRYFSRVC